MTLIAAGITTSPDYKRVAPDSIPARPYFEARKGVLRASTGDPGKVSCNNGIATSRRMPESGIGSKIMLDDGVLEYVKFVLLAYGVYRLAKLDCLRRIAGALGFFC